MQRRQFYDFRRLEINNFLVLIFIADAYLQNLRLRFWIQRDSVI